jgi:hypothetical protein
MLPNCGSLSPIESYNFSEAILMSNKRIVFAAISGTSLLLSQMAFGSVTRHEALQLNGGVEDEALIYAYPGMIGKYNLAIAETGRFTGTGSYSQASAAAFTTVSSMSLGASVSRTDWLFTNPLISDRDISLFDRYQAKVLDSSNAGPYLKAPSKPIEVFAGFSVAGGTLGFRASFASISNSTATTVAGVASKTINSAQHIQLATGFHTNSVGSLDVALTIDPAAAQKRSEVSGASTSETSIKGGGSMKLAGRWIASETTGGIYANGMLLSRTNKVSATAGGKGYSSKFTDQVITLEGGYAAVTAATGPKLFAGADLVNFSSKGPAVLSGNGGSTTPSYLTSTESARTSGNIFSGTMSGEANVAGGLGLMAGMKYVLYGNITEDDNTDNLHKKTVDSVAETSDAALWSIGLFYKADALRIDAQVKKDFLYNGPHFISGNSTAPLFGKIAATYAL